MKMSSKDEDLTLQQRTDRLLGRVAGGRYTPLALKANTSEDKMADDERAEFDTEVKFDVEKVSDLLNIAESAREYPGLKPIFDEALRALAVVSAELVQRLEDEKKEEAA